MNLYFLLEGKSCEPKVYPKLLTYLIPELTKVDFFDKVDRCNYYMFSSNGIPSVFTDISNAVKDINKIKKYNYFVVCVDLEEEGINELTQKIQNLCNPLKTTQAVIIIQKRCLETWFLGNRKVYTRNPANAPFIEYAKFYNVLMKDPELMKKYRGFNTTAQFHSAYLKAMLREKRLKYSKPCPDCVCEKMYIDELGKRIKETKHLCSLKRFFEFCEKVKKEISFING